MVGFHGDESHWIEPVKSHQQNKQKQNNYTSHHSLKQGSYEWHIKNPK